MEALKERGIRSLDMGGINTGRSAGIARFKISSGAQVVTLAGTFWV
jgi:lipid II:glycine glycyltransferase (peptidoglycan interpeptide bridge formation enzyme)